MDPALASPIANEAFEDGEFSLEPEPYDDGLVEPRHIDLLYIEDSKADFQIVNRMLRSMDTFHADAFHAADLGAARRMSADRNFDVILVDYWLDTEIGVHAIDDLGGRLGSAPVILLTGTAGQDVRQIGLRAGAINCLDKNELNPALLETTIRYALHTFALEAQLKQAINDLHSANRAKADFFARMSHDLKTPLNAILGYAEVISEQLFGPDEAKKYAECALNIRAGGTHLLEVLNNLIYHSAGQGTFGRMAFEQADLRDLARRAAAMVKMSAKMRGHQIDLSLPDDAVMANCQPPMLTQAILNVLSNAVKYTPPGGRIGVRVREHRGSGEIRVDDNGIGMSADDVKIVLLPFRRVSLPPELAQDGTGIGLPIVVDILERHGGKLDIHSAPGEGTTVTFKIPSGQESPGADIIPMERSQNQ